MKQILVYFLHSALTVGCGGQRTTWQLQFRDEPVSALGGTKSILISGLRQVILPILTVLKARWPTDQEQFFDFFPSEEEQLPDNFPWEKDWYSDRSPLSFRWSSSGQLWQAFLLLKHLLINCMSFIKFFLLTRLSKVLSCGNGMRSLGLLLPTFYEGTYWVNSKHQGLEHFTSRSVAGQNKWTWQL